MRVALCIGLYVQMLARQEQLASAHAQLASQVSLVLSRQEQLPLIHSDTQALLLLSTRIAEQVDVAVANQAGLSLIQRTQRTIVDNQAKLDEIIANQGHSQAKMQAQ